MLKPVSAILMLCALPLPAADSAAEQWQHRMQPLLDRHCVKCHGPLEQKGGLALDTPDAIARGGDDGAVIEPGKPEQSPLFKALAANADPHMPPKKQLEPAEIKIVGDWITALAWKQAETPRPQIALPDDLTAAIDTALEHAAAQAGITPAPVCDDATFVRRVWLDLAGRIPTAAERAEFLADANPDKRTALVDRLLTSPDYARQMREVWDVMLMGRGKRGNTWNRRRDNGWHAWLEQSFRENRPWPETVRAMITARPAAEAERGSQWFLYERNGDHQKMAEAVAPVIYGAKIDCAQCHDHPLAREILQSHYWGLVAAFNRSSNIKEGMPGVSESAIGGFVNFTNLKKESQPAKISLLHGQTVAENWPAEGSKEEDSPDKYLDAGAKVKVPRFSRRAALAEAAVKDNPLLMRALVNRLWAQFFGRGLVHPLDEMNSRNVPAHPQLMDHLSAAAARSNGDIRLLVRSMLLSRAWQRAAWTADSPAPDASLFAAAGERRLTGEQLARSWRVAMGLPPEDEAFQRAVADKFPDVLPDAPKSDFSQAGFLENSAPFNALLAPVPGNLTHRMRHLPDDTARVHEAFLAAYGRQPDAAELQGCLEFLNSREARPEDGIRDLVWALFSSAEFGLR